MSAGEYRTRGNAALETAGAWLLRSFRFCRSLMRFWAAIHPSQYSAHFVLNAPLTAENFVKAWNAAPFARTSSTLSF